MEIINTTLTTTAMFSDDKNKRYLLHKEWDSSKPSLAIIMLAPSEASGIELDNTTLLVLNNASRLGFGSVSIVNLFADLNDFSLSHSEHNDDANLDVIIAKAKCCDTLVYAPGVGKAKNQTFIARSTEVLSALRPYQEKLHCIGNKSGSIKLVHPLTPCVRQWNLLPLVIDDLIGSPQPGSITKKKTKK